MTISVVIPTYNHYDLLHQLLLDIYKTMPNSEVVIADDASREQDVFDGLLWWKDKMFQDRMKLCTQQSNVGFLKNANAGVERASNEHVLLLNNDVRIYDTHIESKVRHALERYDDVPSLVGARLLNTDTGWNKFGDSVFPYLEGWFLAFRKSEWLKFGGLDERYAPFDYEDMDISTTYVKNGGKLIAVDVEAVHIGGQSIHYSPEREMQTKRNQKKFEDKWLN